MSLGASGVEGDGERLDPRRMKRERGRGRRESPVTVVWVTTEALPAEDQQRALRDCYRILLEGVG